MASDEPVMQSGGRLPVEADVLRLVTSMIARSLPARWSLDVAREPRLAGMRVDAIVEIASPNKEKGLLVVEAKRAVETRDLPSLVAQLDAVLTRLPRAAVPMVAARYLSPSARAWLEEQNVSYGDATGNLRIVLPEPALFLRDVGAEQDPWRGPGRPRGTLQGAPAARVARALADLAPPVTVPELVRRSGASTGATYRVVEFLEREGLIEREKRGPVRQVWWRRMLERWSQDYGFVRSNSTVAYLHPRGLDALLEGLARSRGLRYAITGSFAAQQFVSYAPARLAMIYTDDPGLAARKIELRAVDSGGNVLLAAPQYDVVYERLVEADALKFTAPSQTATDLLTAPGRGPSEGQALLDWMESHEDIWRR